MAVAPTQADPREEIAERIRNQSYTLQAPAGRAKSSKGVAVGTFELYPVLDDGGEVTASVQFVNGKTTITNEIARSVGFPQQAQRLDSDDLDPEPLPPAEALARQIVADYGYAVKPPFPARKMRRGKGILGGIYRDPGEAERMAQARQIPIPAGVAPGSDPVHAVTRPVPEPKGDGEKD